MLRSNETTKDQSMKLSFPPGGLFLTTTEDGSYLITVEDREVARTKSKKTALGKFNSLRQEMETRFPARELTPEERRELFLKAVGDALVGHNSIGGRKKKTTAGSTRTFGG